PAEPVAGDGICPVHPGNASVGACQRCGNFVCSVCRTVWRKRTLCVECVERGLHPGEGASEGTYRHLTASALAVILSIVAWVMVLGGIVLAAIGVAASGNLALVGLGTFVLLGSAIPSLLGVGQGASAIRARGAHLVLATVGLILSGLHLGVLIGLFSFSIWM